MNKRFDNITVARVFAVLAVFICHFAQKVISHYGLNKILCKGSLGVELFFVISGFLAVLYFDKKGCSSESIITYYKKRSIRLLPLFYLVILYFFITETFIFKDVPPDSTNLYWLRYIFLLGGNVTSNNEVFGFWTNLGSTWSVMVFATFYACMPIVYYVARNFRNSCFVTVSFYILRIIFMRYDVQYFHTFTYFVFFLCGFLAYYAIKENKINVLMLLFAAAFICNILIKDTVLEMDELMIVSISSAIFIVFTKDLRIKNNVLKKVISVLDEYSYAIYLCQGIVFCGILDKFEIKNAILKAVISVFGTIILSYIAHNYFEKPISKFLAKKIK